MHIKSLMIRNFKGIESFEVQPDGRDMKVFGANETRKTTIFDACTWLLTGKDSLGAVDFDIKPKHNLDVNVEVEAILGDFGGSDVKLRRVFYEKFTRKRGEAQATFSGNTTDFYIDDIKVQQKDYFERLRSFADEQTLRLLTDARYFNEVMHWRQRRDSLVSWCGDISDEDVIATDERFMEIPEILGKLTIEQFTDQSRERKAVISDELGTPKKPGAIKIRIDEANRGMTKSNNSTDTAKVLIKKHTAKINGFEQDLNNLLSNPDLTSKNAELAKAKFDLSVAVDEKKVADDAILRGKRVALNKVENEREDLQSANTTLKSRIESAERVLKIDEESLQPLRERFEKIKNEMFKPPDVPGSCPACGEPTPLAKIEEANEKALEAFNESRGKHLQNINSEGKELKASIAQQREKIASMESEFEKGKTRINELNTKIAELKSDYDSTELPEPSEELLNLHAKVAELEKAIESIKKDPAPEIEDLRAKIGDYRKRVEDLNSDILINESNAKAEKRIEQLKEQESKMAAEFEEIERRLFLLNEFTRKRCSMLDERINARFTTCKFKLFNDLQNGGTEEVCEMIDLNGASYWSTNNATRIKGGAEIIRIAQEFYGIKCFVVFDNRESVTVIPDMGCQTISLYVSPEDTELRVVYGAH